MKEEEVKKTQEEVEELAKKVVDEIVIKIDKWYEEEKKRISEIEKEYKNNENNCKKQIEILKDFGSKMFNTEDIDTLYLETGESDDDEKSNE